MGEVVSDDESFLAELEEEHLSLSRSLSLDPPSRPTTYAATSFYADSKRPQNGPVVGELDEDLLAELELELELDVSPSESVLSTATARSQTPTAPIANGTEAGDRKGGASPFANHATASNCNSRHNANSGTSTVSGTDAGAGGNSTNIGDSSGAGNDGAGDGDVLVVTTEEFSRMQAELMALKAAKYEAEAREKKLRAYVRSSEASKRQHQQTACKTATARGKEAFSGVFKRDKHTAAGNKTQRSQVCWVLVIGIYIISAGSTSPIACQAPRAR